MKRQPTPTPSLRARLLLLGGSCLFGLLLCELVVRLGGFVPRVHAIWRDDPGSIYRRSGNPLLVHELKPGFQGDFPQGTATANSHGFRDRERTLTKPPGRRRILMLGDSVVEGVNYVGDEDTLSRQLENVLSDTEVLNLGVSGYCTLAEIELLETRGLAFEPDDVIVIFTGNDFQNVVPEHTVAGGVAERPQWSKHLFVRSALFRLCCLKLNWFAFADEQNPVHRNRNALGENNVVDGFARLRSLANQHGFNVLIVPWPDFAPDGILDFERDNADPLLVERLARMNGLPTFRIGPAFRDHHARQFPNSAPNTCYTVREDCMHPNAVAAKVAAAALKERLSDPLPPPPYEAGPPDPEAIAEARMRGGQDDVPDDASLVQRTYLSLRYQGRAEASEDYLREVITAEPDNLFARAYLGKLHAQRGEYATAQPHLEKAVLLQPDAHDIRVVLAETLFHTSGPDAALNTLAEGIQLQPNNPHLRFSAAFVLFQTGRLADAQREVNTVLQLAPEFPAARELSAAITQRATEGK